MKLQDSQIRIDIDELLTDEVVLELSKRAVFNEKLLEAVAQLAISDRLDWSDEETASMWSIHTSSVRKCFEDLRRVIATQADATAQKMIADLTCQREKLEKQIEEFRLAIFDKNRRIESLEREVRSFRTQLAPNAGR